MPLKVPEPPFSTYVLAHLPGWTMVLVVAWICVAWLGLPLWAGLLVIAAVFGKDVLSYRTMRHYYTPEPADRRLVGRRAVVVRALTPQGTVRVHGELWQGIVRGDLRVPEGSPVRIVDVDGLLLVLEPEDPLVRRS